jgi:phenylglyoxylate dehydrogenase epsilon subunit
MEDAHKINQAAKTAKSAVILGTGLVGMHAAESLAKKGLKVELVRGRRPAVLPNYFDKEAGKLIHKVFLENGVLCNLNNRADQVESLNGKSKIILKDGNPLEADLLLVGTGVRSRIDFIANSGLHMDKGIVVDNMMRTSVENVWAAGDVAQADDFFSDKKILNGILPDAFEQGKIAGASMAGKETGILNLPEVAEKDISFPYAGGISMNTFNFYENRAFSVGMSVPEDEEGYEIDKMVLPTGCVYQKMIFKDSCLVGFFGINVPLEPGIIMNIIRRKVDMRSTKAEFAVNPLGVSRRIMWSSWRG